MLLSLFIGGKSDIVETPGKREVINSYSCSLLLVFPSVLLCICSDVAACGPDFPQTSKVASDTDLEDQPPASSYHSYGSKPCSLLGLQACSLIAGSSFF